MSSPPRRSDRDGPSVVVMTGGTSGFGAITAQRLRGASDVRLTTSGAHDPATGAGLTQPRHADAELLAHPDRDPGLDPRPRRAGQHAYTASRLCTVLTARALWHDSARLTGCQLGTDRLEPAASPSTHTRTTRS